MDKPPKEEPRDARVGLENQFYLKTLKEQLGETNMNNDDIANAENQKPRILLDAQKIINGERAIEYGNSKEMLDKIAAKWSVTLGIKITPEQVCLAMIDLKTCRLTQTPTHRDSWLDIAGYVGVKDRADHGQ